MFLVKVLNPRSLLVNLVKVFLTSMCSAAAFVKIWYQSSLAELIPLGFSLVLLSVAAFGMQWSTNAEEFVSFAERKRIYIGSRDCFLASILSLVSSAFLVFPRAFPFGAVFAQSFYFAHTVFFALSILIALWGLNKLLDASISRH
ncbi:MAG: hypothetical protein EBZ51_09475 [Synechococcaceae bacterium WB9_2_112]|nr:hypothetical protein [Synechococcaceae bacterium WB9_2_112]